MKVTLTQFVKGLGAPGAVVEVSPGYAHNFLLSQNLARVGAHVFKATTVTKESSSVADSRLQHLAQQGVVFQAPANEAKLYGGVGEKEIQEQVLKQTGVDISQAQFVGLKHLKLLGAHMVTIRLHGQNYTIRCIIKADHGQH